MDWLTRLVLRLLGWRSYVGRDSRGAEYVGWVKRTRRGPAAYFHVYHEKCAGGWDQVLRPLPRARDRTRKK